jgi:hypothetical protein
LPKLTRKRIIIIAGVIVAIVVVAGISLFWGPFFLNEHNEKQLKLISSEKAQSIVSGQNITIRMEVYNSGSTSIFNASNLWPIIDGGKHRLTVTPCSYDLPYGLAIIAGYVNDSSIASSIPLNIWEPGIYMCPAILDVIGYKILGLSDQGYMLTFGNSPTPITLSSTVSFSGYWVASNPINNSNPLNNSYNFIYFPVGQYTVFIADEWGETALLHFTVT